ncbi:AAEL004601-PA [Aedes aegypti]|uniref:AAEL004601-PA n=1 Tax=Aedes aegypti TaxID=7159 RepID=Q17CC6_AEDAE|nr:AAEL004601-PA [Aedes aegypti]
MIRTDPNMRRKYIKFLRRIKTPRQSVDDAFGKICTDDAIFRHFSWTSQKTSHPLMQRESLQQYAIFTDCMIAEGSRRPSNRAITSYSAAWFNFPITSEQAIEDLEITVRCCRKSRQEYVEFLRKKLTGNKTVFAIFQHIFTYQSIVGYCWTKRSNSERKPMQEYEIFTSCMLDAWGCKGVTEESLAENMRHVVRNANIAKRKLKIRMKRKIVSGGCKD